MRPVRFAFALVLFAARAAAADPSPIASAPMTAPATAAPVTAPAAAEPATAPAAAARASDPFWGPLELLGQTLVPGDEMRLALPSSESFSGRELQIPVFAIRGLEAGPTLCLVAGVHGDEVNGIEVVRRVVAGTRATELRGTVLALPIANLSAFRRGSRYLPDRRDLNRYFPGTATGSAASRIANAIFEGVVRYCDALVDLHTGSFHRKNLHHVRADMDAQRTAQLARSYGAPLIVHHVGGVGTLRRASTDLGVAAITVEAGEPGRFDEAQVIAAVAGIGQLFSDLDMRMDSRESTWIGEQSSEYRHTIWVRADNGGILFSRVGLGDVVRQDQVLGVVTDPLSEASEDIRAPYPGRVFGMAFDQIVMPGFAAYHLAVADRRSISAPPPGVVEIAPPPLDDPDADELEERPE